MKNNMQDINEPKINLPEEIKLEDGTVIPVGDISYEASYLDGTHDPESFNGYILTFEVSGKGMAAIRIIPSMTDPDDAEHGVNYTEFTEDDEAGIDLHLKPPARFELHQQKKMIWLMKMTTATEMNTMGV